MLRQRLFVVCCCYIFRVYIMITDYMFVRHIASMFASYITLQYTHFVELRQLSRDDIYDSLTTFLPLFKRTLTWNGNLPPISYGHTSYENYPPGMAYTHKHKMYELVQVDEMTTICDMHKRLYSSCLKRTRSVPIIRVCQDVRTYILLL